VNPVLRVDTPRPTASPQVLPTETLTPAPEGPTLYLNQTSNCREGPSTAYEVVYSFPAGTQFEIIGQYGSGWWLVPIDLDLTRKKSCWIHEEGNAILGDLSGVAFVEPSPLPPTEAPVLSGDMPIYDFYTGEVIAYISCADASQYEWEKGVWSFTDEPVYYGIGLYGNDTAKGIYERDAINICGW
jgi:hypothetical protein